MGRNRLGTHKLSPFEAFCGKLLSPQGWKTNGLITQNAVLFASAKLTLCIQPHSQVSPTTSWENAEQTEILAGTAQGWPCIVCFFIVRLILLCHMVKDWSLASKIAGGRQEKLLCICLQVSSINECTNAALNKNAQEEL